MIESGDRVWYWQGRRGQRPVKIVGIVKSFDETQTLARIRRVNSDEPLVAPVPTMVTVVTVEVKRLNKV